MSVLGIDIGNAFCVVAAANKGGIDVILNEESKRETPACIAIGARQRFLGAAGASPPPGTIAVSQIKRLIGRPLGEGPKRDLETLFPDFPFSADAQGYPLLQFQYRDREEKLSPTQLFGMLLGSLKRSADRHLSATTTDCCIAVPAYFNNVQRRAVLHAAEIAGLRPLRLLHECSAAALEYGIYRGDLPADRQDRPHVAAFVDVGHSASQVAIAVFRAGEARIVARAADPNLGGRDFDEALFNHFARKLKEEDPELDVFRNPRAASRLRAACEKLKKVLSANPEASLNIECFMEDKDASGVITREEFENICKLLLESLKRPLKKALRLAGMNPKSVEAVELIGSGSRVPAVVKVVGEVFEQEPRRTLNASECVARGCALQAAMLSPAYKVKEFKIHEYLPLAVDISWNDSISEECSSEILTVEEKITTKSEGYTFTIKESGFSFDLQCRYTTANQMTNASSTYRVGPFHFSQNGSAKLKIDLKSSSDGIILVDSVKMLRGKESSKSHEEPSDDGSSRQIDENPPGPLEPGAGADKLEKTEHATSIDDSPRIPVSGHPLSESSVKMMKKALVGPVKLTQDGRAVLKLAFNSSHNGIVLSVDPDVMSLRENEISNTHEVCTTDESRMKTNENPTLRHTGNGIAGKKTVKASTGSSRITGNGSGYNNGIETQNKLELEIKVQFSKLVHGVLSAESLEKAKELEIEMTTSDRQVEDTKDRKNALESYVYEMRSKLRGKYRDYVSDSERNSINEKLQQTETWLYEEGEDVNSDSYTHKLDELKTLGGPIETRFRESLEWQPALDRLVTCITDLVALTDGKIPESTHIDKQGKEMIRRECKQMEWWLSQVLEKQAACPTHVDPTVKVSEIHSRIDHLTKLQKWHTTARSKEVAHWRRTLESYVYEMMGKLHGLYGNYVSDTDRNSYFVSLKQSEKWLHDGGDLDCGAYISRLNDLKLLGDPIERRFWESSERKPALFELQQLIEDMHSKFLGTKIPQDASMDKHYTLAEILGEHERTANWLYWAVKTLNGQRSYEDPIVTVAHIQEQTANLEQNLKRYHELIRAIQPKSPAINMLQNALLLIKEKIWSLHKSSKMKPQKEVNPPQQRYESRSSHNRYEEDNPQYGSDNNYTPPSNDHQMPRSSPAPMEPADDGAPYQLHLGQQTDLWPATNDEHQAVQFSSPQPQCQPDQETSKRGGPSTHPLFMHAENPVEQSPGNVMQNHPGTQLPVWGGGTLDERQFSEWQQCRVYPVLHPNQVVYNTNQQQGYYHMPPSGQANYMTSSGLPNYNQYQGFAMTYPDQGRYMTGTEVYDIHGQQQGRHAIYMVSGGPYNQVHYQRHPTSSVHNQYPPQGPAHQEFPPQYSHQTAPWNTSPQLGYMGTLPLPQ